MMNISSITFVPLTIEKPLMRYLIFLCLFCLISSFASAQSPDQIALNGKLMEVGLLKIDSGFVYFTQNSQTNRLKLNSIDFIIVGFVPRTEKYKKQDSLFAPYILRADEAVELISSKPISFKHDYRQHANILNNQFGYTPSDLEELASENKVSFKRNLIGGTGLLILGLTSTLYLSNTWRIIPAIFGTASGTALVVRSAIKKKRAIQYKSLAKSTEE
jgi:hypothetical protein